MAKGSTTIRLKYHSNFELIEPWFGQECQDNIISYSGQYSIIRNELDRIQFHAKRAMLLNGRDLLSERLEALLNKLDQIIEVTDAFSNMKLYDIATEKRKAILSAQRSIISNEREKYNAQWQSANSKYGVAQGVLESINSSELLTKMNECDADLNIIATLEGRDDNVYD